MKFASFKKLINPDTRPYHLAGFGNDRQSNEPYFGVPELYLKICWIKQETSSLVFITLDTLYFSKEFTHKLTDFVNKTYQIDTDQIIFNASHTHSAPNISMPLWSDLNAHYIEKVEAAFYEGIHQCAQRLQPGYLILDCIKPDDKLFISRRKKVFTLSSPFKFTTQRLPNHTTEVDQDIRLIKVYNHQQELETVLYNFSCHPVFNRSDEFSSDFIGDVSKKLEEHIPVAMFLQGFCGDTRANYTEKFSLNSIQHILRDKISLKRKTALLIKLLFYREIFTPYTKEYYHTFINTIYSAIKTSLNKPFNQTTQVSSSVNNYSFTFTIHSETQKSAKEFRTHIISIGKAILVSIPAEVNSYYFSFIRKLIGENMFFALGYGSDMICYLPGPQEIDEGGYEVSSFKQYEMDAHLSKSSLLDYEQQLKIALKKLISENG